MILLGLLFAEDEDAAAAALQSISQIQCRPQSGLTHAAAVLISGSVYVRIYGIKATCVADTSPILTET